MEGLLSTGPTPSSLNRKSIYKRSEYVITKNHSFRQLKLPKQCGIITWLTLSWLSSLKITFAVVLLNSEQSASSEARLIVINNSCCITHTVHAVPYIATSLYWIIHILSCSSGLRNKINIPHFTCCYNAQCCSASVFMNCKPLVLGVAVMGL